MFRKLLLLAIFAFALTLGSGAYAPALAAGPCFCATKDQTTSNGQADCFPATTAYDCETGVTELQPTYDDGCKLLSSPAICETERSGWMNTRDTNIRNAQNSQNNNQTDNKTPNQTQQNSGIISSKFDSCNGGGSVVGTSCGDVSIFIELLFEVTDWIFAIIGALALLMFVYGGFMFILSQGNAERVGQGKSILAAAVIGLVIAFGGYMLVKFLATALGVDPNFILK